MKIRKNHAAALIFLLIAVVLPLYFEDEYFNITEAKGNCYMFGILPLLGIAAFAVCTDPENSHKKRNGLDTVILLFAGVLLLSTLFSSSIIDSFTGYQGWRTGAWTLETLILVYFIISRWLQPEKQMLSAVLVTNLFIFIAGILHSCGIDVLWLHAGINPEMYYWYISTIGNINWYAGYLCLFIPSVLVLMVQEEDRKYRVFMTGTLSLAAMNGILCASDSIFTGLGFCSLFLFPYILQDNTRIQRVCPVAAAYGISLFLVKDLPAFAGKYQDISGISKFLLDEKIAAGILLLSMLMYVLSSRNLLSERVRKICIAGCEAAMLSVIVYFVYDTAVSFNDDWGTQRGLIWRYSAEIYKNYSLKNKLIGIGPEMLREWYAELSEHMTRTVLVSHSEPLQLLLTAGAAGLLCWVLIWGNVLYSYLCDPDKPVLRTALFMGLIAYGMQGLFNSCEAMNAALLFLFFGMYRLTFRR